MAGFLAFSAAGCNKKEAAAGQPETLQDGMMRLRAALTTASPEVQSNLYYGVNQGIRYADYRHAALALQQIDGDPSLTAEQKKVVNDVNELLKQAVEHQQNAPQPAQ